MLKLLVVGSEGGGVGVCIVDGGSVGVGVGVIGGRWCWSWWWCYWW